MLALPIITGLTMTAIKSKDQAIGQTALTLGASKYQAALAVIREARIAIISAIVAGLGRVIAEVGAVMMVGGNIQGKTRVMTTAIVLETRKGNFEMALSLGIILLVLAFIINSILMTIQGETDD
jgi:tungstate transport system permease protein